MKGKIAKVMTDRGYGFIEVEEQEKEVFFHKSNLSGVAFYDLKQGQDVDFEIAEGRRGPEAINISLDSE